VSPILSLPRLGLEMDGVTLSEAAAQALGEMRVQQRLSQPALCELTFREPPRPLAGLPGLRPGAGLVVRVEGHARPLFSGQVTALEHVYSPDAGRELRVRGYDLLHRLRKRQRMAAHVQVTVLDLARELTADLGITVDAETPGPLWPRVIQHGQSDLELLVDLAERSGLYLDLRENVLHLLSLAGTGAALPLALGAGLLEARLELNGDTACRTVEVQGWDPWQAEGHRGTAGVPRSGRQVAAHVAPGEVNGSGAGLLANQAVPDDDHATGLAQAELDTRAGREIAFWGVAEGDPELRPGARVRLTGVDDDLAGQYVLTAVTHTADSRRGFLSELSTVPPPRHLAAPGALCTAGNVSQVDDPRNLGRVKVALTAYDDVETEWLQVMCPAAGLDKGLIALPEVGDRVLVLGPSQDPGQGVVLGGLYGPDGAPDSGVIGGHVRRYTLRLPGGQLLVLDDAARSLRLANSAGSYVELTPDMVRVHAEADLDLAAPGKRITIRGAAIDFEKAG
jgi:phage protein D/phage baseplate assembly protein gpV